VKRAHLLAIGDVDLEQLVDGLLKVECRHDGEVNGATKVDDVGSRLVMNVDSSIGLCE
jgi:hypothetical protein